MLSIAHLFGIAKRKRNSGFPLFLLYIREQNYKPGSVFDSHLSRRTVAGTLQPPRERSGQPICSHTGVAPDRVYSIGHSRADGCALTAPFHPYLRYLHTSGGLFLLHFSSDRSGRALPVILALWSPDFPHGRVFRPFRATVCFPRGSIVRKTAGKVNGKSINKRGSIPCPWRRSW